MKNTQKGFVIPVLLTIIALLVIVGGVYIYKNNKTKISDINTETQQTNQIQQQTDAQTPPVAVQENTSNSESAFKSPNFSPTKDWSIKYISLFKRAIKEKYGIDDKTLNENLIIQSVQKGAQVDGFAMPLPKEEMGSIHYIYRISWAYFNSVGSNTFSFVVKDSSGNDLTDQRILENIKNKLIPIFTIQSIISEKDAINKCGSQQARQLFPPIEAPWYSNDNNILFDSRGNDLIFLCKQIINEKANQCRREVFNLQTGEKLSSTNNLCVLN